MPEEMMTATQRREWLTARGKRHQELAHAATHGDYRCDGDCCPEPSASITFRPEHSEVVVLCRSCFMAMVARDRTARTEHRVMFMTRYAS